MRKSFLPVPVLIAATAFGALGLWTPRAEALLCNADPMTCTQNANCTAAGGTCTLIASIECHCIAGGIDLGDPHLVGWDGQYVEFQGAGEFILARDPTSFQVQTRTQPFNDVVSVTTAVAAQVGEHRVTLYARKDPAVRVDGVAVDLSCKNAPQSTGPGKENAPPCVVENLVGGGKVSFNGSRYEITWPDGTHWVRATLGVAANFDLDLHRGVEASGEADGLLGDGDGDPNNDVRARSGELSAWTFETFYSRYAESWRISQKESLFDYDPGETTETYTDRQFPARPATLADVENPGAAEKACRDAGVVDPILLEACTLDVGVFGSAEAANGYFGVEPPRAKFELSPSLPDLDEESASANGCNMQQGRAAGSWPGRAHLNVDHSGTKDFE